MTTKYVYTRRVRPAPLITAEELLDLDIPGKRLELVRGKLVVSEPPGARHGGTAMNIALEMEIFARRHVLGRVFAAETGFKLFSSPDTVRAPDAGFVRRDRLPDPLPDNYPFMAPDIAVEVLSPRDRAGKVREKVSDWIGAGSALVWVIDPRRRTARVYRPDGSESLIDADGALSGEDVLRGFSCPLSRIL
jgi:Uma2 family endonuclease